jgi:hypothetical protein
MSNLSLYVKYHFFFCKTRKIFKFKGSVAKNPSFFLKFCPVALIGKKLVHLKVARELLRDSAPRNLSSALSVMIHDERKSTYFCFQRK